MQDLYNLKAVRYCWNSITFDGNVCCDLEWSLGTPLRRYVTTSRISPGWCRLRLKHDDTRAETRFCLSPKRTSPFKSVGASVQSTAGSRGVRISGSNAGYTTFRGSVKSTGYPLHSPVSPSLPLPCVTVCHHISTGFYTCRWSQLNHEMSLADNVRSIASLLPLSREGWNL